MRVLVCGSREWTDTVAINTILDACHAEASCWNDELVVIQGGARGADTIAATWCTDSKVQFEQYGAQWDKYGKAAGFIRNKRMLEEGKPDVVWAFGYGKGTDMMVNLAKDAGLPVYRVVKES